MHYSGFVKLHRKILKWGWYTDNAVKSVFLHLLLLANYEPSEWLGTRLYPGQLITSRNHLATELGLSEQQVRTAIKKLVSTKEITTKTNNRYTLITIVNWDDYQFNDYMSADFYDQLFGYVTTDGEPDGNQDKTMEEEIKKIKKIRRQEFSKRRHMRTRAMRELSDLWTKIMVEVHKRVSDVTFGAWFAEMVLISKEGNKCTFQVRSNFRKQVVEEHFKDMLIEIIFGITGETPEIEFVSETAFGGDTDV